MPIKGKYDIKVVCMSTTKRGHYKQAVYKEKKEKDLSNGCNRGYSDILDNCQYWLDEEGVSNATDCLKPHG